MIELLPLSVGIGLVVGLLFTELFGAASGGLIVPGYIALFLHKPLMVATTLVVALITFFLARALSTFLIVYGRRRTALMILLGYALGMLTRGWSGMGDGAFAVIGFVIPGLVAVWMDRQGVLQTLGSLTIASIVVRLLLIILVGTEMLP